MQRKLKSMKKIRCRKIWNMIRFPCINYCDFENLHKHWECFWTGWALLCRLVSWKSRMIVNGSSNLVEFYVKMGKMNCNL